MRRSERLAAKQTDDGWAAPPEKSGLLCMPVAVSHWTELAACLNSKLTLCICGELSDGFRGADVKAKAGRSKTDH